MKTIKNLGRFLAAATLLLAGLPAMSQDGVSKTGIVIGQSLALTGPGSALAVPFHQGARMYFDRVNGAGGVNGRKIELVTLDDQGNPATTAANTKKLLDQGVLSLFGYVGSPQVTAAYPLIKDGEVMLFAPMSAADEFRGSLYSNVYSIRPGYSEEAAAITKHAQTLGARKLAIMHATDGESLSALEAAERTMSGVGADLLVKSPINSANIASSVDKALGAKPESVLVISDASGASSAVRNLRAKGFRGPIYGFSNTGESLLAEQLGTGGAGVVVVRVVPRSDNQKLLVVRELIADLTSAKLGKPNVYLLEGYIAARVYTEALRRIPKDPTRAKLKKAVDALDEVDIGGFRVHFKEDRAGSKLVELGLIDSQGRVRE
ncbi:MAG TPA: ABC transporter substrate-binding protein [Polaromonas sp.]|uniref:ABC transporter substrate-binding protein n=1 Tax=Polaromonas sp. TaxID=1869339 RepID=UPI002D4207D8|nr:ABC transporter substrate-binding protein [Polaromonas sp.]HYW56880.1 ABC transporter substrate-binding protein [Polaromonas sp.]